MILGELIQKIGFHVESHDLEHLHEKLEGINRSVKFLAAAEIAKGFYELAERFANFGEHMEATAIAAGLTTDELQKLQYAASQNAVQGDELAGALAKLNRQLYAARQGSKQAQGIFAKLGIGPEQIATFKNSSDALAAIQDKMMGVTDANERQALTMQLFGRGSSNMVKFLVQGSEATKELGDSAEKMGAVVSKQGIENLAKFEDAASGLKRVVTSFLATVGSEFAPVFVDMIHNIERSWADNLPLIQETIKSFVIKAAYWLGFVEGVVEGLIHIISVFAHDHAGLLAFVAKWAPIAMVAAEGFGLVVESLGKITAGWKAVAKYAPVGWKALLWGFEKLQLFTAYALEGLFQFFNMFSPGLAMKIRAVGLAMTSLTPVQFALVLAAITALVVAGHDLYEYFFKDVPFEKLWIGRLLKRAEPIISRLKWLLKPFKQLFNLGDMDADAPPLRPMTAEQTVASRLSAPMQVGSRAAQLFSGAGAMGVKFDAQDPGGVGHRKTNIVINSPVNITMSKSMETRDVVRMANEGVANAWQKVVDDAWVDVHPAAAR